MAKDAEDQARPLTVSELKTWLGNIEGMHGFSKSCTPGSDSFMLYHDGMPRAANYIRRCVELTPLVTAQQIVDNLNAIVVVDRETVHSLVETRFFCSKKVEADDCPAVPYVDERGNLMLGMLGVINGLLPPASRVVAVFDDAQQLVGFKLGEVACAAPTPARD